MSQEHGQAASATQETGWERQVLEKALLESLSEQRRARRWSMVFKVILLLYLGVGVWWTARPWSPDRLPGAEKEHTAVIDVFGMIADGGQTNADAIIEGLRKAEKAKGVKGIVLRMNTPGGTPVQSAYVYDEIRRLKKARPDLPIYAVVSDVCASGGYYIAAATDKIFVNPASVIGSIGVIMNGFGFVGAMEKLGIERRVMTAGEHKAILDPFSPVNDEEKAHVQKVLDAVHQQFIRAVREGRGERLKDDPQIFSGLIWTGKEGIELGLADGVGDLRTVAETVVGAKEIVNYSKRKSWLERLTQEFGTSVGAALAAMATAEPRLH